MNDSSILKKYVVNGKEYSTGYTALETKVIDEVDSRLNQFSPTGIEKAIIPDEEDLTTQANGVDSHLFVPASAFADFTESDTIDIVLTNVASYGALLTVTYPDEDKTGVTKALKEGVSIASTDTRYIINGADIDLSLLAEYGIEIGGDDFTVNTVRKNGSNVILDEVKTISTEHTVIKFNDKVYAPEAFSGKGRIILRKNIESGKNVLLQSAINANDVIYIVQYDFDLNGEAIEIPSGAVLDMRGGSFNNGMLVLNDTEIWPNYDHITRGSNLEIKGNPAVGTTKISIGGVNPRTTMADASTGVTLDTAPDKTIIRVLIQNADENQPVKDIQFKEIKVDLSGIIKSRSIDPEENLYSAPVAAKGAGEDEEILFGAGDRVIDPSTGKIDMSQFTVVAPDEWSYDASKGIGTLKVEEAFENGIKLTIPESEHDVAKYIDMNFAEHANVHVVVDYTDGSQTSHTMTHYDLRDHVMLHQHKIMSGITIQGTRTKKEIINYDDLYRVYMLYEDEEIVDDETGFIITFDPATNTITRKDPSTGDSSVIQPEDLTTTTYEHQFIHISNLHVVYPEDPVLDEFGVANLEKLSRVDKENEHLVYDPSTKIMTYSAKSTETGVYLDIPADEEARGENVKITLAANAKLKVFASYLGYHGGHAQIFDGDDWRGVPQYVSTDGEYYELKF